MKKFFAVVQLLAPLMELGQDCAEYLLDALEDYVQRTDNKIDDALALPAIKFVRSTVHLIMVKDEEKKLEVIK